MEKSLKDIVRVVVETDEENPITIATVTNDDIDCVDGYRVRLKFIAQVGNYQVQQYKEEPSKTIVTYIDLPINTIG